MSASATQSSRENAGAGGLPDPAGNAVQAIRRLCDDQAIRRLRDDLESYQRRRARSAGWWRRFVPTGLAAVDAALPHGGLPCGAVTEILAPAPGVGAMSLAMRVVRRVEGSGLGERHPGGKATGIAPPARSSESEATGELAGDHVTGAPSEDRFIVVVDTPGDFYPPAVNGYGLSLDRLIVIRPGSEAEALWATNQALRCPAVAAVIASFSKLEEIASRRLQLAAESSGAVGLMLRPARTQAKSFAAVRLLVEGVPGDEEALLIARGRRGYLCDITVLSVREGTPTGPHRVDLNHEAGACPVFPVPVDRPMASVG
ncbi:MAG: hypothetical protein HY763_14865 [Planctomycetes bacterium]|nr:hypothetical protein [Planctomycetota bacterium]